MHRRAQVKAGEKMLIIGASGGIGTALIQLGKLAELTMYGLASPSKHALLCEMGVKPIDYHTQDFVEVIRRAEPDGLDVVIDGMSQIDYIRRGLSLLRRGGRLVSYGEPAGFGTLWRMLLMLIAVKLLPNGKSFQLYGTSSYFLFHRRPFLEDWAALFNLLAEGKIKPIIAQKFPILEAAQANQLLESGMVIGNVVLVAPELL
jgi:NADPH:quinone reductase-like Zn-dependent oxidoreductase